MTYSFISGATGGIGSAFAICLAKQNANLFLTGRSIQKLNQLKSEIINSFSDKNIDIVTFACDMTKEEERKSMFDFIDQNGYTFDRICNVAGVDIQKGFTDYTLEKLLFQIRVNCEGTVSITHQLLQRRAENLEIVTVSSMSGVSPMPYFALYSASKSMLTNLFTALHYELKDDNVKVTTVLPGGVYTRPDIVEDIKGQGLWGKLSAKTPEFVAQKSLKAVKKNKVVYIPGFFNKFLNFVMKILPKGIVLNFIKNRWKKQTKDAF